MLCILMASAIILSCCRKDNADRPNVVIMFLDDSGWADFEPFGSLQVGTPHVSELAATGTAYHRFYVPQAICSASRAALISGCYPGRTRVSGGMGAGHCLCHHR
jgi:arylsulfatase A